MCRNLRAVVLAVPQRRDQLLFADFQSPAEHRLWRDGVIRAWADSLAEADPDYPRHDANPKGETTDRNFFSLMMHFFNRQTHHRGQVTALLEQVDIDIGNTGRLTFVRNETGT